MPESSTLRIDGPAGKLEAIHRGLPSPRAAAVLAHPHPLYGGSLHNPVVFHADRALHRAGFATLRFNFRGVGRSEGFHDDGRGEPADVGAAVAWLRDRAPGVPLFVVGYSFGSRAGLMWALSDPAVAAMIGIGLPTRIWRFDEIPSFGRPLAVVQGSRDEFGPLDEVRRLLASARPAGILHVVEGAPHLFPGRASEAGERVTEAALGILESL